jgi:hypothetical protein
MWRRHRFIDMWGVQCPELTIKDENPVDYEGTAVPCPYRIHQRFLAALEMVPGSHDAPDAVDFLDRRFYTNRKALRAGGGNL